MITSLQTNDELVRRVREIRARPGFVHPCERFWVEVPKPVRKSVRRLPAIMKGPKL